MTEALLSMAILSMLLPELGDIIIKYEEPHACYLKSLRNYQPLREQQCSSLFIRDLPSLVLHFPSS